MLSKARPQMNRHLFTGLSLTTRNSSTQKDTFFFLASSYIRMNIMSPQICRSLCCLFLRILWSYPSKANDSRWGAATCLGKKIYLNTLIYCLLIREFIRAAYLKCRNGCWNTLSYVLSSSHFLIPAQPYLICTHINITSSSCRLLWLTHVFTCDSSYRFPGMQITMTPNSFVLRDLTKNQAELK